MTVGITVIGGQVRRACGPSSASSLSGPPAGVGGVAFGAEQPDDDVDEGKGKAKGKGKPKHEDKRRRFTRKVRCRSG